MLGLSFRRSERDDERLSDMRVIIQQIRKRECRNLDLQSPTQLVLSPIRRTYPFCSVLSRNCFFPSRHNSAALEETQEGLFYLYPCFQEVHSFPQTVFGISASDRLCFCSQYLATLNCLSFTVCRSFCGTSLMAAYSPHP